MKWIIIAQVAGRPRAQGAHQGQDGFWWFEVSKGPRRLVKCSCGGSVVDRPHAPDITFIHDASSACAHITALYSGDVTEDKAHVDRATGFRDLTFRLVRLTEAGKMMFYCRWTVRALSA